MMVVCFSDKNRMKNAIRLSVVKREVVVAVEGTSPLRGANRKRSVNLAMFCVWLGCFNTSSSDKATQCATSSPCLI